MRRASATPRSRYGSARRRGAIAWLLTVHLFGLTMLLGSVVIMSLHLLGLFQRRKPVPQLRREIRPVMLAGLCVMIATGALIFTGGAQAYYEGYWFRLKMVLLIITLLFHFTVFRVVTSREDGQVPPRRVPANWRGDTGVVVQRGMGRTCDRVFLSGGVRLIRPVQSRQGRYRSLVLCGLGVLLQAQQPRRSRRRRCPAR